MIEENLTWSIEQGAPVNLCVLLRRIVLDNITTNIALIIIP